MEDNIIEGLTLTIVGSELIAMCQERIEHSGTRLTKLEAAAERVEKMDPEDREISGFKMRSGDMAQEVADKQKKAKADMKYFKFLSEHLEGDATYRINHDVLRMFKLKAPSHH